MMFLVIIESVFGDSRTWLFKICVLKEGESHLTIYLIFSWSVFSLALSLFLPIKNRLLM